MNQDFLGRKSGSTARFVRKITSSLDDTEVLEIGKDVEKLQMSCKHDEEPQGHPTSEIKQEEVQKEQNDARLSTDCSSAEGDSLYHATEEESQMEGAQINQKHDDSSEVVCVISTGSALNVLQHDPEASHLQRGLSRRCLQFEETFPPPCLAKMPLVVSRPFGIGLHLNSFTGHKETATVEGGPGSNSQIIDKSDAGSSSASMVENAPVTTGERMVKDEANVAAISEPFGKIEALNVMQPIKATPLYKRKLNLDFTNTFEGLTTKKKRYCDCFAASIYCADPCSCQGCFNRPEYRDTVLETRHQIESRHPLAFAPKIVQNVTKFPATIGDDTSLVATSSVRHKRECNCKKSMCLKKYCECYQAYVGCSHECRSEGCKNLFGKKVEYGMTDDMISLRAREETLEGPGDDKLGLVATNNLSHLELYDQHCMTPLFQFSDHGKEAPKPQFGRFVPSPESDPSMLPPYARTLNYPSNAYSNDVGQETNKELVSHSSDQLMHHDIQMMNQYSPGSEEIASICDFSPSQNPFLPSASSKTRSWIPPCPGSRRLLPTGSLRWRISPMTPMAP